MAHLRDRPSISMLMRALIPSWCFFDFLEEVYYLHYRQGRDPQSFGPYQQVFLQPLRRGIKTFFFNPEGNARLSYHSVVENLVLTIPDAQNIESSVPYQLVQRILRKEIQKKHGSAFKGEIFQFKITAFKTATGNTEDLLVSQVHTL